VDVERGRREKMETFASPEDSLSHSMIRGYTAREYAGEGTRRRETTFPFFKFLDLCIFVLLFFV
jgi:hypothetical protein